MLKSKNHDFLDFNIFLKSKKYYYINMLSCEYCYKEYKTVSSLNYHKKTAKKCLAIREKINETFVCNFCDLSFSKKFCLESHTKNCKEKETKELKNKIKELETENIKLKAQQSTLKTQLYSQIGFLQEQNGKLQDDIKFLAETAINKTNKTITHNNNYVNLKPIDQEYIIEQVKNLTLEHIKKGAIGYSSYFLEHPLKDSIVCSDFSRKKIKYKNKDGSIVIDPEMTKLSGLLFDSIRQRNKELSIQYISDINQKIGDGNDDNMEYWMDVATKFSEQDLEVLKMFNGEKNGIFHDILRNICCKVLEK